MRFKAILVAVTVAIAGQAHAALFSETTTLPLGSGEFPSYFDFALYDSSLGNPTSVQVTFTGYIQPKLANTGLAPDSLITVQPDMSVEFYGPILEPTLQGDPLTLPVGLAGAGSVGGQSFTSSYELPLSFLQAPGGSLSGFTEILGPVSFDSFLIGDSTDTTSFGGQFTLNVTYDPIDEPASPFLLGSGLIALAALRMTAARVTRPSQG